MRIIALSRLKAFWAQPACGDAEQPLRTWVKVTKVAQWQNPPAVKATFNSADMLKGGRMIFDIGGNKDRLDVLATLLEAYEAAHYPVDAPDPIAAIEFMMAQKGLARRDLEPAIGGRGRVSEIFNRKRPLTLPMIRALAALLELPADVLIRDYPTASAAWKVSR